MKNKFNYSIGKLWYKIDTKKILKKNKLYDMMNMSKKLTYNKKGKYLNFAELSTYP